MDKRIMRAVVIALTLGAPAAGPARAQVGPDARTYSYGRPGPDREPYDPPPGNRPPPDDGYDWRSPPPDDGYDRPRPTWHDRAERRRWDDSVCVTARGTCLTRGGPPSAPCGCRIPGFGYKRGQIED